MTTLKDKGRIVGVIALGTLIFSVFRRSDIFFPIGNLLAEKGWPLTPILLVMLAVRFTLTGFVVMIVLPPLLGYKKVSDWLPGFLQVDAKGVLLGILSFLVFCILGAVISISMGIYKGDWSAVFAQPDITPDPDVVGWGYFLIALVPGIWEELAFRGLIQTKFQQRFTNRMSILLSTVFFTLFHLTNMFTQAPSTAIGGVIMSFFFGLAWGVMTVRSRSVIPAMIGHYLVDSMGQAILNVNSADPIKVTLFFLLLTLTFPVVNILLTNILYREKLRLVTT